MFQRLTISLGAVLLAACGEGGVIISLTDAPVDDLTAVSLQVTAVELQRTDGSTERIDITDRDIDLLALTAGNSTQLASRDEVTAGSFSGVRLFLNANPGVIDSFVTERSGGQVSLLDEGDLFADGAFEVDDEDTTRVTIDVDLRRGLRAPAAAGGDYVLVPALRLVRDDAVGTVRGTVAASLVTADGCDVEGEPTGVGNVGYVFTGTVTPDDIDNLVPDPLSSARVVLDADSGDFDYVAAFLPAGDYTLAFTCQGELDEPTSSDAVVFSATALVTVTAGASSTANLTATAP